MLSQGKRGQKGVFSKQRQAVGTQAAQSIHMYAPTDWLMSNLAQYFYKILDFICSPRTLHSTARFPLKSCGVPFLSST